MRLAHMTSPETKNGKSVLTSGAKDNLSTVEYLISPLEFCSDLVISVNFSFTQL
jgi:hypothetical protein